MKGMRFLCLRAAIVRSRGNTARISTPACGLDQDDGLGSGRAALHFRKVRVTRFDGARRAAPQQMVEDPSEEEGYDHDRSLRDSTQTAARPEAGLSSSAPAPSFLAPDEKVYGNRDPPPGPSTTSASTYRYSSWHHGHVGPARRRC